MASRASLYLSVVGRAIESVHVEPQKAHMKILKNSDKLYSAYISMPGIGKDRRKRNERSSPAGPGLQVK